MITGGRLTFDAHECSYETDDTIIEVVEDDYGRYTVKISRYTGDDAADVDAYCEIRDLTAADVLRILVDEAERTAPSTD